MFVWDRIKCLQRESIIARAVTTQFIIVLASNLQNVLNTGVFVSYTRKNWSAWCKVVRWTTPEQCCYQGSTTLVEFTVLMSIVWSIVVQCWQRTIVVTMLLEHELTIVDEKSLLIVVNNDWTMVVECEQLWTMVVDNICWQGAAQHCFTVCSTTLQQVVDNIDQGVHFCACRQELTVYVHIRGVLSWRTIF